MTAARVFATAKPSSIGAPVLPMSEVDRAFWAWRERRKKESKK